MNKSCGGCQHFQKWKNYRFGGGLCNLHDCRARSDSSACQQWKHLKFHRNIVSTTMMQQATQTELGNS